MKARYLRRFSPLPLAAVLALVTVVGFAAKAPAQITFVREPEAQMPLFTADALPVPPQQRASWTPPPSSLSPAFITAAETLFSSGLPDPRGCEYREISVVVGSVWGGASPVAMRGWLLPAEGEENRFAIGWDGLVHPVIKLGPAANLTAELADTKPEDPAGLWLNREKYRNRTVGACLLLRLGEVRAAEKMCSTFGKIAGDEWFSVLSNAWVGALWERGICAHMRGDDRLALLDFRRLTNLRSHLEALARQRGVRLQNRGEGPPALLTFLDPLPLLLADQERRARERANLTPLPSTAIARLVADLDKVAARQWGQPGGVDLREDPVVQQLIAKGESAVEPLLDVIENDRRLTRSVSFHRDFFPQRYPQSVAKAAYLALCDIWGNYSFGSGEELDASPQQRASLVARVRTYWGLYKNVSPVQRWRRVLADDKSGEAAWRQAARSLVVPGDTVFDEDNSLVWRIIAGDKLTLPGESLRATSKPSINALLEKRVEALSKRPDAMAGANQIALAFAAWDKRAALPLLRRQSGRNIRLVAQDASLLNDDDALCFIARTALLRAHLGDMAALDEYGRFLERCGTKIDAPSPEIVFEPLFRYPYYAGLENAAELLFATPTSPWSPLRALDKNRPLKVGDWTGSAMICVPAFRRQVLKQLDNKATVGSVSLNSTGEMQILTVLSNMSTSVDAGEKMKPPAGSPPLRVTLRVCDYYAWQLSKIKGAPRCEPYWPLKSRDWAVAASRDFLRHFADRFRPVNGIFDNPGWFGAGVRLEFPRLNRIASSDDVARGAAIFTLIESGEKRIVALKMPLAARRKFGKSTQKGLIWQAEELLQNGKWRRFYGFVGPHEVVKIPAEEVELGRKDEG